MYYIQTEWIGAVYATPSFAGSRSGFSSAGAWYSLLNVTKKGYNENSRTIIAATKETVKALRSIEGVTVFGEPCICALAFSYSTPYISCFDIVSYLVKVKGWELSPIHLPNGIHVSMTLANYEAISKQLPIDVKSAI